MWQFQQSVEGISEACEALGIPVVGGNVSFYNETDGLDIHPTPVVGLLGVADPMPSSPPRLGGARTGMEIWEIGPSATANLAGSAVQRLAGELAGSPTAPDPVAASRVIELAIDLAHVATVLHDISDGGLAAALAEVCIASGVGAIVETEHPFNEDPHRLLAVVEAGSVEMPAELARRIGQVGGDRIVVNGGGVDLADASDRWHNAISRALAG
jgi:phosphoribosylformylglycinamidine synthase